MLLRLDFKSEIPIYMQIRDQIVMGIASGQLAAGDKLPTMRALADEIGINMMTVNKSYQLLKQEGYIHTDRRGGTIIAPRSGARASLSNSSLAQLRLILSEAKLSGISKSKFFEICEAILNEMDVKQ